MLELVLFGLLSVLSPASDGPAVPVPPTTVVPIERAAGPSGCFEIDCRVDTDCPTFCGVCDTRTRTCGGS